MGRIEGDLRQEVAQKLASFDHDSLLDDAPKYDELRPFSAWLVSERETKGILQPAGRGMALLDQFGGCDSNILSAWIISALPPPELIRHFKGAAFAYGESDKRFLLRYYAPLVTPVLRQLAGRKWVDWFSRPLAAWWYPVATPTRETWSRIEGGGQTAVPEKIKLLLTDKLMEGLANDPFTLRLLNFAQDQLVPSVFSSACYGVRLAQIEEMLETAQKQHGLKSKDDLTTYVLTLLDNPGIAREKNWQEALRRAASSEAGLDAYYSQV
jgi:hypothetical protein